MSISVNTQPTQYEQALLKIVRTLPPSRIAQLIDFAHFLASQVLVEEFVQDEDLAMIEADNTQWESLLATEEAQSVLDKLAEEALVEHRAGKTKAMTFTATGKLASG